VPLHTEVFGVLTTADKPYSDWKELNDPDITLVQVRGTTPIKFIEENLPEANVTLLDNYPDVIRALAQGRGDAMVDVIDFVGEHMNKHDVDWKVVETPVTVYYVPVGVAKGNDSLRDWLNVAIYELHRTGVVDETWKKWFGMDMIYPVEATPWF
jgi:polar amino acid transport system substrate-binding protein